MDIHRINRAAILMLFLIIAVPAQAGRIQHELQTTQELRSLAFLTCANALVYFNQNGSPYELRNKQDYQQRMLRLQTLARTLGYTDVVTEVQHLQTRLDDTDELPQTSAALRSTEPSYSRRLLPVIESHAHLQALLDAHYAQLQGDEPMGELGRLHAISRAMGELLVNYQIASFNRLGAETWILGDEKTHQLDHEVVGAFERLSAGHPALAEALEHAAREYSFVRSVILKQDGNWAPNGAERYMRSTITDIDQIAKGSLQ
jgi:hypothetical protein